MRILLNELQRNKNILAITCDFVYERLSTVSMTYNCDASPTKTILTFVFHSRCSYLLNFLSENSIVESFI